MRICENADKSFLGAVITIALPVGFQNLLATTAGLVDTIMIGSEGELAMAAVGISSQFFSLTNSCCYGFAGAALLFFAQYWGTRDEKGINRAFGIAITFMMSITLIFCGLAVIKSEFILGIYTDKESIVAAGIPYIRIAGFAYPLQVAVTLLSYLMRSTERVKAPLIGSVTGMFVNFILNWILIYGRFGMPKMGVAGAAVGTLASTAVNVGILLFFLLRSQCMVRMRLRDMFNWKGGFSKQYLGKAFPILCSEILYGFGQMLMNVVIGRQSESAIAAVAAFQALQGMIFAFYGGISEACSVLVGKEIGAGQHMKGYQYMKKFAVYSSVITFALCLAILIMNRPVLVLFGLGAEAMFYVKYMLVIFLAAGTLRACNFTITNCYRASGEPVFGAVLEISGLFLISVPATLVAGLVLHLPFLAVFACIYMDEMIRLIFEIGYTRSGKWIKPVTEAGKRALPEFWEELRTKK